MHLCSGVYVYLVCVFIVMFFFSWPISQLLSFYFCFLLSFLIYFLMFTYTHSFSFFALVIYFSTGRPLPNVTWYLDNTVIDESFEHRPDGKTVNHLSYPNVGRQHLNARLVCVASNTNLTPPNNKVVILDVNCKYRFCGIYALWVGVCLNVVNLM